MLPPPSGEAAPRLGPELNFSAAPTFDAARGERVWRYDVERLDTGGPIEALELSGVRIDERSGLEARVLPDGRTVELARRDDAADVSAFYAAEIGELTVRNAAGAASTRLRLYLGNPR